MMIRRHNRRSGSRPSLTLSEVAPAVPWPVLHDHDPRLCASCIGDRHADLTRAPRARFSAALVAATIAEHGGDVWPAVVRHGISYRHALAIRAGWRGAGRRAAPIPYRSRGWTDGRRNGWTVRLDVVR